MVCCLKTVASILSTWRQLIERPSIRLTTIRTWSTIGGFLLAELALGAAVAVRAVAPLRLRR